MPRRKRSKDPTTAERTRRCRARGKVFERCVIVTVGPNICNLLIAANLLRESELEDRNAIGQACEQFLQMATGKVD
jgi:hypothetical protein